MPLILQIPNRPNFNGKFIALVVLLIIVLMALFSCKDQVLSQKEREAYERKIDSIRIRNAIIDAENAELKTRKPIHDTVYKYINKKVKNELKRIDNFDSLDRVKWLHEFERANTPNQ